MAHDRAGNAGPVQGRADGRGSGDTCLSEISAGLHPAFQCSASSSTHGTPRASASVRATVVLPEPALPMIEIRRIDAG